MMMIIIIITMCYMIHYALKLALICLGSLFKKDNCSTVSPTLSSLVKW